MSDDRFETVAITYRQSETAVIVSMFEFYGIRAYALWANTLRMTPWNTIAYGGIRIRVPSDCAEEARGLLNEAAERASALPDQSVGDRLSNGLWALVMGLFGGLPPPPLGATIVSRAR